jgi:hypothetical protein
LGVPPRECPERPTRCRKVESPRGDRPDVDAELEGGGRDQGAQLAGAELGLDPQAPILREAAMVGRDGALAQRLAQLVGQALGHAPRVDEDERRVVLLDVRGDAREHVGHLLRRGHGLEVLLRQLDRQVQRAAVPDVDHLAARTAVLQAAAGGVAHEQPRHRLDRSLGGREPDAHGAPIAEPIEALEAEHQMRSALVARDGVDLVDDHRLDRAQDLAALLGGDHQEERLGRGDQDLGRLAQHRGACGGGGVTAAHPGAQLGNGVTQLAGPRGDLAQWLLEVLLDVGGERLEGRDVEHLDARLVRLRCLVSALARPGEERQRLRDDRRRACALGRGAVEAIDADQEGRERLARAGGRRDQRVLAGRDQRPAGRLRCGRSLWKALVEPAAHGRVKQVEGGLAGPDIDDPFERLGGVPSGVGGELGRGFGRGGLGHGTPLSHDSGSKSGMKFSSTGRWCFDLADDVADPGIAHTAEHRCACQGSSDQSGERR